MMLIIRETFLIPIYIEIMSFLDKSGAGYKVLIFLKKAVETGTQRDWCSTPNSKIYMTSKYENLEGIP